MKCDREADDGRQDDFAAYQDMLRQWTDNQAVDEEDNSLPYSDVFTAVRNQAVDRTVENNRADEEGIDVSCRDLLTSMNRPEGDSSAVDISESFLQACRLHLQAIWRLMVQGLMLPRDVPAVIDAVARTRDFMHGVSDELIDRLLARISAVIDGI